MSRFSDAVAIQGGASCDPISIVICLKRGIDEIKGDELVPIQKILDDPALRIMVHQLAQLFQAYDNEQFGAEYSDLIRICEYEGEEVAVYESGHVPPGTAYPGEGTVYPGEYIINPDFWC